MTHPARFSKELLPVLYRALDEWRLPVHDPFAGAGDRLAMVCDALELNFTGTEIEPEFIVDRRVRAGDSTVARTYPTGEFVVCTSPSYPNGMSDHFFAKDASKRHTYRQALAEILGHDRPLNANNSARYGIRSGKRAEARYWNLVNAVVPHWPARAVVNVKDFYYEHDKLYPLAKLWTALLTAHGYVLVRREDVPCPGQRHGANRHRVDTEAVLIVQSADLP